MRRLSLTTGGLGSGSFSGTVALSYSGPLSGSLGSLNINTSGSTQLTITVPLGTPEGVSSFTVTGTSGSLSHTITGQLNTLNSAPTPVSISPVNQNSLAGTVQFFTFTATDPNGPDDVFQEQLLWTLGYFTEAWGIQAVVILPLLGTVMVFVLLLLIMLEAKLSGLSEVKGSES